MTKFAVKREILKRYQAKDLSDALFALMQNANAEKEGDEERTTQSFDDIDDDYIFSSGFGQSGSELFSNIFENLRERVSQLKPLVTTSSVIPASPLPAKATRGRAGH